jgi:integrase
LAKYDGAPTTAMVPDLLGHSSIEMTERYVQ